MGERTYLPAHRHHAHELRRHQLGPVPTPPTPDPRVLRATAKWRVCLKTDWGWRLMWRGDEVGYGENHGHGLNTTMERLSSIQKALGHCRLTPG